MGKSYSNPAVFASAFEVQATKPLDARFVLDNVADLTNGTIDYPYVGLVVNIKGTDQLYVLTALDANPTGSNHTWKLIKGAESVNNGIQGVQTSLETVKSEINSKISGVQGDIDALIQKHDADIDGVQGHIEQVRKDLLGDELDTTFNTLKAVQDWANVHGTEYADLVKTVSDNKTEWDGKISGVQGQLTGVQTAIENKHKSDVESVQGQITTLTTNLGKETAGIQGRITNLEDKEKNDIKGVQTQLTSAKSELENKITELENSVNNDVADQISGIQTRVDELESKETEDIAGVQTQLTGVQTAIESAHKIDVLGLQTQLSNVQSTLSNKHNADITGVQGQITTLTTNLGNETAGIQSRITNLEDKEKNDIKGVQGQITTLTTNLGNETAGIQSRIKTLEDKETADISGVQGQISNLRTELLGSEELDETLDTMKEIGDWIKGHQGEYNDLLNLQKTGVQGVQTQLTGVQTAIENAHKIDVLGLQTQLSNVQSKHNADISGVQSQFNNKIDNATSGLQTRLEGVQSQFNTETSGLQTRLAGVQSQFNTETSGLQTRIVNLVTKETNDIKGVQGQITTLTSTHNTDKAALENAIEDSMLYASAALDNWKTVAVGGIGVNTTPVSFEGKTISQVLDMILYPTLYPKVPSGKPSVSISYPTSVFKVGTTIPAKTAFTTSDDRGNLDYATTAGNTYYAGAVTASDTTINKGAFGGTFGDDVYTVTYTATFAAGAQPLNNKGTTEGVTMSAYAGGTKTATKILYGVYPFYVNNTSDITNVVEQSLKNYHVGGNVTVWTGADKKTVTGAIELTDLSIATEPQGTTDRFTIKVPAHLNVVHIRQYDTNSSKYAIDTDYMLANKTTETINGITYNVYKRATNPSDYIGAAKFQVVIKK